jgi:hypothetical protein
MRVGKDTESATNGKPGFARLDQHQFSLFGEHNQPTIGVEQAAFVYFTPGFPDQFAGAEIETGKSRW